MKTIHSHIFSFFHSFIFQHVACCAFLIAAMCSCSDNFHVEGTITEAKDSTLYFEHMSLDGVVVMDSIVLDEDGDFDFSFKGNETPEFYRLRIARNIINVSIDSTETVEFKASYPTMASKYEVEGSDNCKRIKELSILQQQIDHAALRLLCPQIGFLPRRRVGFSADFGVQFWGSPTVYDDNTGAKVTSEDTGNEEGGLINTLSDITVWPVVNLRLTIKLF